jgi:hypothetical protein
MKMPNGFEKTLILLKNTIIRESIWLFQQCLHRCVIAKKLYDQLEEMVGKKSISGNVNIDHQFCSTGPTVVTNHRQGLIDFNPDMYGISFEEPRRMHRIFERLSKAGYELKFCMATHNNNNKETGYVAPKL